MLYVHCIKIYLVIKNALNYFYYNLEIVFYNNAQEHEGDSINNL